MTKRRPSENHYHYTRTTLLQKAVYIGIGVFAATYIRSCTVEKIVAVKDEAERKMIQTDDAFEKHKPDFVKKIDDYVRETFGKEPKYAQKQDEKK